MDTFKKWAHFYADYLKLVTAGDVDTITAVRTDGDTFYPKIFADIMNEHGLNATYDESRNQCLVTKKN